MQISLFRTCLRCGPIFGLALLISSAASAGTRLHRSDVSGTDFYIVFPKAAYGEQNVGVLINSPVKQTITVTVPKQPPQKFVIGTTDTTIYLTGMFFVEYLPEVVRKNKVVHVQSESPITMHGQFGSHAISGTFTALPTSAWGQEYYVLDMFEGHNSDYLLYPTVYSVPTITLVAFKNETGVTIVPTAQTAKNNHLPGAPFNVAMDSGDVYTISTAADPNAFPRNELSCEADFSGTEIYSNKPVGVIVAQSHGSVQCDDECGDYGVEWLPPVSAWDTEYVVPPTVTRLYDIGETYRAVFTPDTTLLWQRDANGKDNLIGAFSGGSGVDMNSFFTGKPPYYIHANHPFLLSVMTPVPQDCHLNSGGDGGEPWTFSISYISGVRQWSDRLTFASAVNATGGVANIFFRTKDKANLFYNGVPFTTAFAGSVTVPGGFAYVVDSNLRAGTYYEIRGENGATASGLVFGHGDKAFAPRGGGTEHPLAPAVMKTFAHPIGFSAINLSSPDTVAPRDTIEYSCGHWDVRTYDDEVAPPASGLKTITLVRDHSPDSSYNVAFSPAPNFVYGDDHASFGIDVVNLLQQAHALVRVRDGAGNQYDTLLVYKPQAFATIPSSLDVGALRAHDSTTACLEMINHGSTPVTFTQVSLRFGTSWHMIAPSPAAPFTVQPGDSVRFCFEFVASASAGLECDPDTLFATTCKRFPVATMIGCNKRAAISAQSFDFGDLTIDTLGRNGDHSTQTLSLRSVGSDVLHVTKMNRVGENIGVIDTDFAVIVNEPSVESPWVLNPGTSMPIVVDAHPHHTGVRKAFLIFESDAGAGTGDTMVLLATGIPQVTGVRQSEIPTAPMIAESYPNPFSSSAILAFAAPSGHEYIVNVFDNLGVQAASLSATLRDDGRFAAQWSPRGIRTGAYHFAVFDATTGRRVPGAAGHVVVVK